MLILALVGYVHIPGGDWVFKAIMSYEHIYTAHCCRETFCNLVQIIGHIPIFRILLMNFR